MADNKQKSETEKIIHENPLSTASILSNGNQACQSDDNFGGVLTRDTASAYLAFLYLSRCYETTNSISNINEALEDYKSWVRLADGFVVPVLRAREGGSGGGGGSGSSSNPLLYEPMGTKKVIGTSSSVKSMSKSSLNSMKWTNPTLRKLKKNRELESDNIGENDNLTSVHPSRSNNDVEVEVSGTSSKTNSSFRSDNFTEIHFGLEFSDTFTSYMVAELPTLARQLQWTIVDPLVSALALGVTTNLLEGDSLLASTRRGNSSNNDCDDSNIAIKHDDGVSSFTKVHPDNLKQWRLFLETIGVVNFFGVYPLKAYRPSSTATGILHTPSNVVNYNAPFLLHFLKSILKNGRLLLTDRIIDGNQTEMKSKLTITDDTYTDNLTIENSGDVESKTPILDSHRIGKDLLCYVPLFTPSSEPVFNVTATVFNALQVS